MLKIAYSGCSKPSALALAEAGEDVMLVRRSSPPVDINWGRNVANSELNPNINNSTNKRKMRELFKEHGVPMPKLWTEAEACEAYISGKTPPLIGRPDRHTKGRGLWKINSITQLNRALLGRRRKRAATHFMEYIESDREYRVHIFKGKSIRISEKDFDSDGKYTTKKPGNIHLRNIREAAKNAVQALDLDFGAVDILARGENNREVFVLEVNASPGLGGTMPQLYIETFRRWKEEQE